MMHRLYLDVNISHIIVQMAVSWHQHVHREWLQDEFHTVLAI
jgi:hypothetical protein